MNIYIGVDISKLSFDCCILNNQLKKNYKFQNNEFGFKQLFLLINKLDDILVTMENTGTYHLKLATFLYEKGFKVSIVNPGIIHSYIKMKMIRVKTDKKDAEVIAEYSKEQPPCLFTPNSLHTYELRYILNGIDDLKKIKTQFSNQLEALNTLPVDIKQIVNLWNKQIHTINEMIKELEDKLSLLVEDNYADTNNHLRSIPGLGPRLTSIILAYFGNFETFENSKQVSAYIGINPSPYQSGTSVKKKGSISKKGNKYIRKMIYMSALSASRFNKQCKALKERLKAKGKPFKVILIAVANKLLRQVFAIVKYKRYYDPDYIGKKPMRLIA